MTAEITLVTMHDGDNADMGSIVYGDGGLIHGTTGGPMGGEDLAYLPSLLSGSVSFARPLRVPHAAMADAFGEIDPLPVSLAGLRDRVEVRVLG